jgi:signal transduction histidine kinase
MGPLVVFVRRAAVVLILLAGYAYERVISGYLPLASIGLISFCAVANFAPGLVLGLYWRRAHRYGVLAGLAGGFVVWLYALLLPSLRSTPGGPAAPLHDWLPAPVAELDPVGQGFVVAIVVNTLLLVGVSLLVRAAGADAEQADAFVLGAEPGAAGPADARRLPAPAELRELLARFVGPERAQRTLGSEPLSIQAALAQTERALSGTLGAASARVIVGAFGRRGRLSRSARALIDEASEAIRYNYDILRNSLDHVGMGIAAFDKGGRLEISNDRFGALLPLDHALLRRPDAPQEHEVGTPDGRVIELRLDPLPSGGFVATCNDVTARVRTAEALRESDRQLRRAAETLEQRVAARTAELESSRAEAEAANLGKTRLHCRREPRPAAAVACRAAVHRRDDRPRARQRPRAARSTRAWAPSNRCSTALLDISKLDAGAFKPERRAFALQPLFDSLGMAFAPVAAKREVELVIVRTRAFVDTDPAFLRRILQNLLSNALRYGRVEGRPHRVLLGCRREGSCLRIEVKDNGPGIAADKQQLIFDEFVRLQPEDDRPREERGLGLGLAIVDRIGRMLELPVRLASAPRQGSTFSVVVPRVAAVASLPVVAPAPLPRPSIEAERFVLCIDNEARCARRWRPAGGWGCRSPRGDRAEALPRGGGRACPIWCRDLHLDEGPDGLESSTLRKSWNRAVPPR